MAFAVASSTAPESGGGHVVELQLLAPGVTLAVPVTADVIDAFSGSASSGADYTAFGTQVVTFPMGAMDGATQPATLGVLDDSLLERAEDADLSINSVSGPGTSIGTASDRHVTILDDEPELPQIVVHSTLVTFGLETPLL